MTLGVFFAVLFAAALHAGWNALVKTGLDRFSSILFLAIVQGGIAAMLPAWRPGAAAGAMSLGSYWTGSGPSPGRRWRWRDRLRAGADTDLVP